MADEPKKAEPKPTYTCWKCGKGSWAGGGRPICCYCKAKAKLIRNVPN